MSSTGSPARSAWSGKWAFILAAAASAVGLGNMWRFPYLAAKYGGGTFLLTYLVLVFTFGASLLLLETALGRKTGLSAIGAFKSFGKKYAFIGVLTSAILFIIVPYYCIIGGWVTKYTAAYLTVGPEALADGGGFFSSLHLEQRRGYVWMLLFMAIVFVVVALGVKGGIEKANLIMMPALIVMAAGIAIYTITMPGALEGVAYYLTPDFSKFSPELVIGAMGQMFYSLSLAMGIMITYGSYLNKKESLPHGVSAHRRLRLGRFLPRRSHDRACGVRGHGVGRSGRREGGSVAYVHHAPGVFGDMGGAATIVGFLFFLLVLFAALTSAISLTETCVSIISDGAGWSRKRSLITVIIFIVVAGCFVNAGYNALSFIQPLGEGSTMLDFFDFISNSVMMPIAALLTCVFVGWIIKPKTIADEIKESSPFKLEKAWTVMIKYIAPVLIVVILVAYVAQQFGFFSM